MRYRDAAHVDLGSFHARLPWPGLFYLLLGLTGIGLASAWSGDQERIGALLVVGVVAWLRAWQNAVGNLWRVGLVGTCVACALILTFYRWGLPGRLVWQAAGAGACP